MLNKLKINKIACSATLEEGDRQLNVCSVLNLDSVAAVMTDSFSLLSGGMRTDENWAEHDSNIQTTVPKRHSDPFVLPKEPVSRIRSPGS